LTRRQRDKGGRRLYDYIYNIDKTWVGVKLKDIDIEGDAKKWGSPYTPSLLYAQKQVVDSARAPQSPHLIAVLETVTTEQVIRCGGGRIC
jgi:hypothetical protein